MSRIHALLALALLAAPALAGDPAPVAGDRPATTRQMGADSARFADTGSAAMARPIYGTAPATARRMGADSARFAVTGAAATPVVASLEPRLIYGTSAGE